MLKELLGEGYKEGMSIQEIETALSGKKLADLSSGQYVDKNKFENETKTLKEQLKAKEDALKSKMTDEEKLNQTQVEKDKELETLRNLLKQTQAGSNKDKALALVSESKTILGIKEDDKDFDAFLSHIVTEDTEKVRGISTYVNKLIKDAYDKGKKDNSKDSMGKFGQAKADGSKDSLKEVDSLGKRLAGKTVTTKEFDYFAKK